MHMTSSRWRGLVLAMLCVALAPAISFAQQGRGGAGGGRGGFGGGFGGGTGVTGLLAMQEVQTELKLTDEQKTKLREAQSELRGGFGGGAGGNREEIRNLSREERQKRMEEFRKQMEERTKKAEELVKGTLTADQSARLNQLRLQREGFQSLSRAEVAAALKVTDAQKEAIADILQAARPQRGAGGSGAGGARPSAEEREKAATEAAERRKKTQADVEAVLTDDQKAEWTKLLGAKFEFPERPAGGGRGGRGGQGGGQGGGQNRRQRRPAEA